MKMGASNGAGLPEILKDCEFALKSASFKVCWNALICSAVQVQKACPVRRRLTPGVITLKYGDT